MVRFFTEKIQKSEIALQGKLEIPQYQHFFPLTLFPLNYEGQQIQSLHLLHYKFGT